MQKPWPTRTSPVGLLRTQGHPEIPIQADAFNEIRHICPNESPSKVETFDSTIPPIDIQGRHKSRSVGTSSHFSEISQGLLSNPQYVDRSNSWESSTALTTKASPIYSLGGYFSELYRSASVDAHAPHLQHHSRVSSIPFEGSDQEIHGADKNFDLGFDHISWITNDEFSDPSLPNSIYGVASGESVSKGRVNIPKDQNMSNRFGRGFGLFGDLLTMEQSFASVGENGYPTVESYPVLGTCGRCGGLGVNSESSPKSQSNNIHTQLFFSHAQS